VNLQIFTRESLYIKIILACLLVVPAIAWDVDFSRRAKDMQRSPASIEAAKFKVPAPKLLQNAFPSSASHEVVILSTEKGFIPAKIQLKKGERYKIHVVNVNQKDKNVSFILDSFAQHFGTFYGRTKSFELEPSKEGIYSYISPELGAEGKIIVVGSGQDLRLPASAEEK